MQKTEWKYIENFTDPEIFQAAFDLVESDGRMALKDDETGIYSVVYGTQTDISTEIEFNRKFIKRYSCTCGLAVKKLCFHLIAATILYRRSKEVVVEIENGIPKNNYLPSRVSIPAILSQIPKDELDRFLQRYARINKNFGQALKLHFASKVQVSSPEQKYHDLIKSMTRLMPLSNGKLSKTSIQSLFWVSEELLLQAEDLIALNTPIEAFAICMELLQSYLSIYRKLDLYIGEYEKYYVLIHQKIKQIIDFELAPDLRTQMVTKLVTIYSDPGYPFINSPNNLFEILYPFPELEVRKQLAEITLKKIGRKEMNSVPLQAWIKNALKFRDEALLLQSLHANDDTSKWLSAIDAIANMHKEFAKQIAKWLLLKTKDEFWKHKLMDKIWTLFPDESDSIVYALGLLTYTPDEKYTHYLINKQVSPDMIEDALLQSKHVKTLNLLINFYLETNQTNKAKIIIEKNLTLDLLKSMSPKFYPQEGDWLFEMYKISISKLLENYLGPIPATKIQSLLGYLQLIKAKGLAELLQKWLKKEFSDHPTLMETI